MEGINYLAFEPEDLRISWPWPVTMAAITVIGLAAAIVGGLVVRIAAVTLGLLYAGGGGYLLFSPSLAGSEGSLFTGSQDGLILGAVLILGVLAGVATAALALPWARRFAGSVEVPAAVRHQDR
jgi:hypothetical protein